MRSIYRSITIGFAFLMLSTAGLTVFMLDNYCSLPPYLQAMIPEAWAQSRACSGYCEALYPGCDGGDKVCGPGCYDSEGWVFCAMWDKE